MIEKILNETTSYCEICPKRECCPEEEYIFYRIKQILLKSKKQKKKGKND